MNVDFEDLDYSKMIVDVSKAKVPDKKSPQELYEILQNYDEFWPDKKFWASHPGLKKEKVFRYFPLVYDKNSPLRNVIENIKQLKGKAAELSGFKKDDDGKYNDNVEAMMSCRIKEINLMIIRYITLHKSAKYHQFAVLNEVYNGVSSRLLETHDLKDVKAFDELTTQIDDVKQDLLSGDNSKGLEEDLNEYYFSDRLQLRPEDIATRRLEGEASV